MEYIEVFGSKGLRYNAPSTMIEDDRLVGCNDMAVRQSILEPVSGSLAMAGTDTVPLKGVFLAGFNYNRVDVTTQSFVVHTTSDVYKYNGNSKLFEMITDGVVISDCEVAWVAGSGDTTTDTSTDKRKGTYSNKFTVAVGIPAETILATRAITSANYITYTSVHLYLKSSVAFDLGDLQLLLDDTALCASPQETIDLPALTANVWTEVTVSLLTPANLIAVISVGIKITVNKGAFILYVDDVRATKPYTVNASSPISNIVMSNVDGEYLYVFTKGADGIKKWNGTGDTVENLAGWTTYRAKVLFDLANRLVACNMTESSVNLPLKVRWSKLGNIEYTADDEISAGSDLLITEMKGGEIIGAARLGDAAVIYGSRAFVLMTYTSKDYKPFDYEATVMDKQLAGQNCIFNMGDHHILLCKDGIYIYRGGYILEPIDSGIKEQLFKELNQEYIQRSFFSYDPINREVLLHIPTGSYSYPNTIFRYSLTDREWMRGERFYSGTGVDRTLASTIGTFTGIISSYTQSIGDTKSVESPVTVYGDDKGKVWIDGQGWNYKNAPTGRFVQTKDYSVDKYMKNGACWMEINCEAKGIAGSPMDILYSLDFGLTWVGGKIVTLTSNWTNISVHIQDVTSKKIRVMFRSFYPFYIRHRSIGYIPLSDRGL